MFNVGANFGLIRFNGLISGINLDLCNLIVNQYLILLIGARHPMRCGGQQGTDGASIAHQ